MKNPLITCYPTVFHFPFCEPLYSIADSHEPLLLLRASCLVALRVLTQLISCWASTSLPPFIYCYTGKSHITIFSSTFWVSQMLSGPAINEFPPLVPTICFQEMRKIPFQSNKGFDLPDSVFNKHGQSSTLQYQGTQEGLQDLVNSLFFFFFWMQGLIL